ncbi:MAG: hypothetical protein ACFFD4_19070, partial [Candidatus Odinarchaeota archaeon]
MGFANYTEPLQSTLRAYNGCRVRSLGAVVAGVLGYLAMPAFVNAEILAAEYRYIVPIVAALVVFVGGFFFDSWFGPPREPFE